MAENFYTLITTTGKAKMANAAALGTKVNFKTLKLGDGNGGYYEPSENQTDLVNKVWEGNISSISTDEKNSNWIIAKTTIPATDGGFFIREAGIFDEDGDLIAIAKMAETYKPVTAEGSTKDLIIKIILEISNINSVTLKIDPNVIVATQEDIESIEEQIEDIKSDISNDIVITPAVNYGMNSVIKLINEASKFSIVPKLTIQGNTLINLLGKDGNCEDVSKWTLWQATSALDSTNKVFGNNGIKVTLSSTQGNMSKDLTNTLNISKYYCFSGYLKNGNCASLKLGVELSTASIYSTLVTDTTKFNRVFIKIKPSDLTGSTKIFFHPFATNADCTSGQYAYVDGVMLEEITQAQYNDSTFQPSPYVDSYTCLQNPYIEVRHDNLVRNGNGEEGVAWWGYNSTINPLVYDSSGYFKVIDDITTGGDGMFQSMNVKVGATYALSVTFKCGTAPSARLNVQLLDSSFNSLSTALELYTTATTDTKLTGVITVPNGCSYIRMWMGVGSSGDTNTPTGIVYIKEIMLVEGTAAPTQYLPCRVERVVLETKLTSDDSITYENGEVTGLINWKHKTLYGKDYDWQFGSDWAGFKALTLSKSLIGQNIKNDTQFNNGISTVKYDGSILLEASASSSANCANIANTNSYMGLSVADSDTGWPETINPNADEVKAFMNGWKAVVNNGTRYLLWLSVIDNSIPAGAVQASVSSATTTTSITVSSGGTNFVSGDSIVVLDGTTHVQKNAGQVTGTPTATNIPTVTSIPVAVGDIIVKYDNGTTNTSLLNWCKNNVAPNYDGYQLHYKLANPEPITDDNCHIHGDIPKFDVGDNYLYLDSGGVIGEVASPQFVGNYYQLNEPYTPASFFHYRTESLRTIYKNNLYDVTAIIPFGNINVSGRGGIAQTSFDSNAVYTVDYKILATQAPQIGSIDCSYSQDISSAINDLQEDINNRQAHDSILDEIVDLSIYEQLTISAYPSWYNAGGSIWFGVIIPIVPKKTKPIITISNNLTVYTGGSTNNDITNKCSFYGMSISANRSFVTVYYVITDSTTITNVKSYGLQVSPLTVTVDCRGRI